ncbi:MAG: cyanophycin synthetase [Gemmatimonadales bacterium]|nr:cyanophycin synthetase [Gemmatimonadales bacterium]
MQILDRSVFVGPSLYAHFPVIRLDVDLGELEDWPSGRLGPAFTDGLLAALPGLRTHGCSYGTPGGFVRRLTEDKGTWMGHILEHVAIELQNVAGHPLTFGKTRALATRGRYMVIYQYEEAEVGLEAADLGLTLLHSLLPGELRPVGSVPGEFAFATSHDEFIRFAQRHALGPSTASLIHAAEERRIPWIRIGTNSLIQLGHGRFQQRVQATITSQTSHIAVDLASDKEETNKVLARLGLPVPRQELVQGPDDAAAAAARIGYPVVVKPWNANHGRGITIGVNDAVQVVEAYHVAREHSSSVLIESFISGLDHRMLVINGRLVAVSKRVPGHVVGDGVHTIEQLVDEVNADPRRGIGHEKVLTRLEFDHQAEALLSKRGYDRSTVPPAGEQVFLRATGNLSTGGTAADMTDAVHPDNADMAVRAVRAVGLDVGGVDFLTTDVARSYKEVGGAICEVNAAPGFRMHMAPSEGKPRDVAGPVIDMLFPSAAPCRIPIAAVTGTNGKTTTARMLAHIHKLAGHHVGLTTTDGVYIDGQRTVAGDMTGPVATRMVLSDPFVDVAVLEVARGGLLRAGMGVRNVDVGAVLNVKSDHLGLNGIDTLEGLAKVKRIVVEVARDTAVLNADDPLCLRMADHTDARHVCYVTMDPTHELVREHIQAGGRGMVLEAGMTGKMITLYDHGAHIPLLAAHLIPATLEGRALHNVQNAMFAAAMAFSMGLKLENIRHGLQTFDTTFFQAPGRGNVFDEHPFKVILDYGHNPAAVEAMVQLVEALDAGGRRIVVVAAPGDRRDQDVREIGQIVAGNFDQYICRRDDSLRGRGPEEIPRMLEATLLEHGVPAESIMVVPDETEATELALQSARANDLVLIFGDNVTRSWDQILAFRPQEAERRATRRTRSPASAAESPAREATEPPMTYVRDTRGVRYARSTEAED